MLGDLGTLVGVPESSGQAFLPLKNLLPRGALLGNDFRLPPQPPLRGAQKHLFYRAPRTAGGWLRVDVWR